MRTPWQIVTVFLGCLILGFLWNSSSGQTSPSDSSSLVYDQYMGTEACSTCHADLFQSYSKTAHYLTSREATPASIKGSFEKGRNILRSRRSGVSFRMEKTGEILSQTGEKISSGERQQRREFFDLVVGSGRKGQSYLYWKEGLLFQLPVSYATLSDSWVHSPGFEESEILFDRAVPPRCLECHATWFGAKMEDNRPRYREEYILGITCEKCHGPGKEHVEFHRSNPEASEGRLIINPLDFSRKRQLDACALCHSGDRAPLRPPFSFLPGDELDHFLAPASADVRPDVHANQVGLLKSSRCFQVSDMSCSTCHDVHVQQRELSFFREKCLQCHSPEPSKTHTQLERIELEQYCLDCHMPDQRSRIIQIEARGATLYPLYRNHAIGIFPEETEKILSLIRR